MYTVGERFLETKMGNCNWPEKKGRGTPLGRGIFGEGIEMEFILRNLKKISM